MKSIVLAIVLLSLSVSVLAETKVANYAFGSSGTHQYENLSFWTDGRIFYQYGADRKELALKYFGRKAIDGINAFEVGFPNGLSLYVIPMDDFRLKVRDKKNSYNKIFSWEYEGPVNGIGTFCTPCAADEKAAYELLRQHYLR